MNSTPSRHSSTLRLPGLPPPPPTPTTFMLALRTGASSNSNIIMTPPSDRSEIKGWKGLKEFLQPGAQLREHARRDRRGPSARLAEAIGAPEREPRGHREARP